jgi:endonuclease/exonuclease/phosphatase family metal-dependent hydrolase
MPLVLGPLVYFQSTGTQTIRVQSREDGFSIDQIVLSPAQYLLSPPGALMNDGVILSSTLSVAGGGGGITAVAPPPNQPPQLSISASPTSGTSPLFVNFSSSASDPDGYIASYYWNFGDNTTSSLPNPTHAYGAGSYLAYLTVTDNSGAVTTANVQINVTAAVTSTSTQLKVMSWNVSFGEGTDAVTNWNRTATWIASFNPDLVGLCEMPPDDIGTLVSLLNQKTGRSWYYYFVPKYSGYPEGNLILSKYSFSTTSSRYLSYERSVAQVTVNVGGRNVNFFATHLDAYSSGARYQEVTELQGFMSGFSEPKIAVGDFNAGPDLSETIHMAELYNDSWVQAMNIGTATAYPDNPVYLHTRTRRGRIDYVWTSRSGVVLKSAQIPDVRDLNNTNVVIYLGTADDKGVRPSDHNPMIAIVQIQ